MPDQAEGLQEKLRYISVIVQKVVLQPRDPVKAGKPSWIHRTMCESGRDAADSLAVSDKAQLICRSFYMNYPASQKQGRGGKSM